MVKQILSVCAFAVLLAGQAADVVSGKWQYMMETPDGQAPVILDLKVEGSEVKGTVSTGPRVLTIKTGKVEGGVITLTVSRDRPQGGAMTYQITGKVEGSTMKGTTEADMDGQKVTQEWEAKKQ